MPNNLNSAACKERLLRNSCLLAAAKDNGFPSSEAFADEAKNLAPNATSLMRFFFAPFIAQLKLLAIDAINKAG